MAKAKEGPLLLIVLIAVTVVPLLAFPFILASVASTTTQFDFVEIARSASPECFRADADTVVAQLPVESSGSPDIGVDVARLIADTDLELRAVGLAGEPLSADQELPPARLVEWLRPEERHLGLRAAAGEVHYLLLVMSAESASAAASGVRLEYSPGEMRWSDDIRFDLEVTSSECTIQISSDEAEPEVN